MKRFALSPGEAVVFELLLRTSQNRVVADWKALYSEMTWICLFQAFFVFFGRFGYPPTHGFLGFHPLAPLSLICWYPKGCLTRGPPFCVSIRLLLLVDCFAVCPF